MPRNGRIQSTNFQKLLIDLGITRNEIPFELRSEVTPVVLVGGTVSFIASPSTAYRVQDIFTAGGVTAPAINSILADTLQLPEGAYTLKIVMVADENHDMAIQWRDAANTVNLWQQRFLGLALTPIVVDVRFEILNADERVRVSNLTAGAPATTYQASILART